MAKRETGSVYKRGRVWWIWYLMDGERLFESTRQSDRRVAQALLAQRRREIREGTWARPEQRRDRERTVEQYLREWLARREAEGVRGVADERRYLERFAIPALGAKPLTGVERKHIRELMAEIRAARNLRTGEPLAPRTALHAYRALATAFGDAVLDGFLPASPCTLRARRGELPKKEDRDLDWRTSAVYTRPEAELLLSDDRVPLDRRVLYGLMLLTGMRANEAHGRRWRDYDPDALPLGRLEVTTQAQSATERRKTKTGARRVVPVHPALASLLAEWKLSGFARLFGRSPRPDDPIIPSRRGVARFRVKSYDTLVNDLERIGLRRPPSARHAMRATFLTLAESSGCNMAIILRCTHAAPSDVVGGYIRTQWSELCAEVAKIRFELRRKADVIQLRRAANCDNPCDSGPETTTRPLKTRAAQAPHARPLREPSDGEHDCS